MDALDGIWRLVDSRASIEEIKRLLSAPYGVHPMGTIMILNGRMLSAVCNGDEEAWRGGGTSSYGGPCTFDGSTLDITVDIASDPRRIGTRRVRSVTMLSEQTMILRPPVGLYAGSLETRELIWERVWTPGDTRTRPRAAMWNEQHSASRRTPRRATRLDLNDTGAADNDTRRQDI